MLLEYCLVGGSFFVSSISALIGVYYLFNTIDCNCRHLRHPNIIELLDVLSPTILSRIEDSGILKGM